jgi:hypothetical protein
MTDIELIPESSVLLKTSGDDGQTFFAQEALEVWQECSCQQHIPRLFSTKRTFSGNRGKQAKIMGYSEIYVTILLGNYNRNMLANSSTCILLSYR